MHITLLLTVRSALFDVVTQTNQHCMCRAIILNIYPAKARLLEDLSERSLKSTTQAAEPGTATTRCVGMRRLVFLVLQLASPSPQHHREATEIPLATLTQRLWAVVEL